MATDDPGLPAAPADAVVEDIPLIPVAPAPTHHVPWRLGLVLFVLSVLGSAAILPFSISLMRQAKDSMITPATVPIIAVISMVIEAMISAAAIAVGIALGRRTGLGPFLLDGLDGGTAVDDTDFGEPASRTTRAWKATGLAAALGVLLGAMVVGCSLAFDPWMPKLAAEIQQPAPLEGLLASVGAGIREEVWLRLGFMTFLAWLAAVITGCKPGNAAVIWSANVVASLAFGAIHLPQAAMLLGLNAGLVAFVFIGNGVPGIVFGWLFWRRGLLAAMVAHFMLDVVLKVILPAVSR